MVVVTPPLCVDGLTVLGEVIDREVVLRLLGRQNEVRPTEVQTFGMTIFGRIIVGAPSYTRGGVYVGSSMICNKKKTWVCGIKECWNLHV